MLKMSVLIATVLLASGFVFGQKLPINTNKWKLVFEEEFDSLHLDTSKWSRTDWHSWTWKYSYLGKCDSLVERRTESSRNLIFDTTGTGSVVLRAIRESPAIKGFLYNYCVSPPVRQWVQFDYSIPAWLITKERWKYGYFEIRAKLDIVDTSTKTIQGIGAAFWLYRGSWNEQPVWSEIDVFEYQGLRASDSTFYRSPSFTSNTHFRECHPPGDESCDQSLFSEMTYPLQIVNNTGEYHTYAVKWTRRRMEFYFDGELYCVMKNHQRKMASQNMIIDMAIGTGKYSPLPNSQFPFNYTIDRVRVFQIPEK